MGLNITNEEIQAIKYYKENAFENINQLLIADSRADIVIMSDEQNEGVEISYDKSSVVNYIETIKKVYKAMLKYYLGKGKKEDWAFTRNATISEIEKFKTEPFIDRFIITNINKDVNQEMAIGNNQVVMYISGEENIPYIILNDVLKDDSKDVLISLFTKVSNINENTKIKLKEKTISTYTVKLEKQELEEMSENDNIALYNYIISNSDLVNTTLSNTVRLEKENVYNYESIREIEKQVSDMELEINRKEMNGNYSESNKNLDNIELKELKEKLEVFKNHSAEIFSSIKDNNKFITEWKKNVTVYLMDECSKIERQVIEEMKNYNNMAEKEVEEFKEYAKNKKENLEKENFDNVLKEVKAECQDNITMYNKLMKDINRLINRQQNFAKIAGNLGATYSALNNAFDIKKKAEELGSLINTIKLKVDSIGTLEISDESNNKLLKISEVNNQIGILMNYLNNPKTAVAKSKMNRFDEMIVVEENELKRDIAKAILDIRGEAELKKLRDDTNIIEDKSPFMRFLGIFTGQNKLDEFMLEQIELRQNSIKKTLSKKLRLDYNYSVHEFIAEIRMFIKDNEDDDLVLEDVSELREFEREIAKNFIIIESKVQDIINEKESKNMPLDTRITKKELIEIETYRFLNKYGYDLGEKQEPEEVIYADTTLQEIGRIIEYINTSKILE